MVETDHEDLVGGGMRGESDEHLDTDEDDEDEEEEDEEDEEDDEEDLDEDADSSFEETGVGPRLQHNGRPFSGLCNDRSSPGYPLDTQQYTRESCEAFLTPVFQPGGVCAGGQGVYGWNGRECYCCTDYSTVFTNTCCGYPMYQMTAFKQDSSEADEKAAEAAEKAAAAERQEKVDAAETAEKAAAAEREQKAAEANEK